MASPNTEIPKNFFPVEKLSEETAENELGAKGVIPENLELFQDHFPEFPVLPGVLALELLRLSVECCLSAEASSGYRIKEVKNVKFTRFLSPGDAWESRLSRLSQEGCESIWKATLIHHGERAVAAAIILEEINR